METPTVKLTKKERFKKALQRIKANKLSLLLLLLSLSALTYFGFLLYDLRTVDQFSDKQVEELIEKYTVGGDSDSDNNEEDDSITKDPFDTGANRLIIPEIGLDVGIYQGGEDSLEKGIWNRFPERGTPESGGNFILSGHRFTVGFETNGLRRGSPLFNIDRLGVGDKIEVVWKQKQYTYEIKEVFLVKPSAVEIEDPTATPTLTLYTCTLRGSEDGRVVIRAVPVAPLNTFNLSN